MLNHWTKVKPEARRSPEYGDVVQWFLSKIGRIVDDRVLSHVLGAGATTLDIAEVLDQGKVCICYLPAEKIGMAAAHVLGKWIVMRLRDAILTRSAAAGGWTGLDYGFYEGVTADTATGGPEPFFVYVDEFSRFATRDFCRLLAESRKHNVGFTLSFQSLSQTRTYSMRDKSVSALEEAILANCGSMVCYPMGAPDATRLSGQLDVEAERLKGIRRYRPLARLVVDNAAVNPHALVVERRPEPDNPGAGRRVAANQVLNGTWVRMKDTRHRGEFRRMLER